MKYLSLISPILKSVLGVIAFLVGLGWTAFISVHTIVKAEGQEIRREVKEIREIDLAHIDQRFNVVDKKLDKIEQLIKETK
jgi:hypothetical protein